jgi:hypothetical protein
MPREYIKQTNTELQSRVDAVHILDNRAILFYLSGLASSYGTSNAKHLETCMGYKHNKEITD